MTILPLSQPDLMNIPLEIAKNYLIKVPFINTIAKKKHITGVNQDEVGIQAIFDLYHEYVDFVGKDVVELGPGHTYGVAKKIVDAGAASMTIIDIDRYIPDEDLKQYPEIQYIVYPGQKMPLPSNHFDVVLSYTVYEHLRQPEVTVRETFRILKKGGLAIHLIDLGDHMHYGIDDKKQFNHIRYSPFLWNLISRNRSIYVNRIQLSGWRELHKAAGFDILSEKLKFHELSRSLFSDGGLSYLNKIGPEDRFVSSILLVTSK